MMILYRLNALRAEMAAIKGGYDHEMAELRMENARLRADTDQKVEMLKVENTRLRETIRYEHDL